MDFQSLVNSYGMAAAVLSVEKTQDGHWGEIRIVCANAFYKQIMGPNYKEYDKDNLCYFMFYFEFTKTPDAARLSNISLETAPFVIQTCINLRGAENFYDAMNTVISDIREKTESFCSCIIMIDKVRQKYAPLCAKFSEPDISIDDFMPYLTPDVVFSWEDTLKNTDCVIVKDDFDMDILAKKNPIWVESLRSANVKSLILTPLLQGKKMTGVLFITNFNVEQIIQLKDFIELTAFFLSAEVSNNDLMERLEYMSNVDTLTGVKNRNSMNTRVYWHVNNSFPVHTPYGVVFADLNGLKQCNDNGGHEAGDKLLKNAADFEAKVAKLCEESGYGAEASLAIGADWSDNGRDLRECMHIADEAMYADKKEFYKNHPDKAR